MSAAVFSPISAVVVHSAVPFDDSTLTVLQSEDFLLVHSCPRRATRQLFEDHDYNGRLILSVYYDPRLTWTISAEALSLDGLANYHPGLALSTHGLAFLNGTDLPFLFKSNTGILIYEDPQQDPGAGDLIDISFEIELKFGDLDPAPLATPPAYQSSLVPTPSYPWAPSTYADVPVQASAEISAGAANALLRDVFTSDLSFSGADVLTIQCYDGLTALTTPTPTGAWGTPVVGSSAWIYKSATTVAVTIAQSTSAVRTVSRVVIARGALIIGDIILASPLSVPAGHGIRIPIGAITLQLTWPLDGTPLPTATDRPSRHLLPYLLGTVARATAIPSPYLYVTWSNGNFSTPTDYDSFAQVPALPSHWTVSGLTVRPVGILGPTAAPPDGYPVASVTVHLHSGSCTVLREYGDLTTAVGQQILWDTTPHLDLAAAPD